MRRNLFLILVLGLSFAVFGCGTSSTVNETVIDGAPVGDVVEEDAVTEETTEVEETTEADEAEASEDTITTLPEWIAEYDTDGDGQLSQEEREVMREAFRARVLERFDSDGDGELSEEERTVRQEERRGQGRGQGLGLGRRRRRRRKKRLEQFDTDGDGELSQEEREAAIEARRAKIAEGLGTEDEDEVEGAEDPEEEQADTTEEIPDLSEATAPGPALFDADGDGSLSEEERETLREAHENLRDDDEVQEARSAVRSAYQSLWEAMQSGDESAVETAREDVKAAHLAFRELLKTKLEAAAALDSEEQGEEETDTATD